LPLTETGEPTCVPPVVQLVGAAACGPNTVKVIVPPAPLAAPDRVELIELAEIGEPATSLAGADAVVAVAGRTFVEVMPAPHRLLATLLFASPP
jgi:hypothetical protein